MDRAEFFKWTLGRTVYIALLKAVSQGATGKDITDALKEAITKAERATREATK